MVISIYNIETSDQLTYEKGKFVYAKPYGKRFDNVFIKMLGRSLRFLEIHLIR